MWTRQNKLLLGKVLLLLGIIFVVMSGLTAFGCIGSGTTPIGWSGVAIADDALFLGSKGGKLVALDISTHNRLWPDISLETSKPSGGFGCAPSSATAAVIYGTPVVAGDLVYVGSYDGKVHAISSSTGVKRWVYPPEGNLKPIVGGLLVSQGKVYFGCSDGKVYALDVDTGDPEWESPFQTGDKIWSTPAINDDTLFIGSFDRKLYAIDAKDGSKRWEFEAEGAVASIPVIYNNTVYIGSFDRHLYAVNATDGSLKWRSRVEAGNWFWTSPIAYNGVIYAGCVDGKVYILDAESGYEAVSAIDLESPIYSSPVLIDSSIIIASEEGKIHSLNTDSNQIRQLASVEADTHAPLMASDGVVYIHTQKKESLYALNAQTGVILWNLSLSAE